MIDLKKINVFKLSEKIQNKTIRYTLMDKALALAIPFNMGLGMRIKELTPNHSLIEMPPKYRRRNHLGTAHAIAQALLGEYCAGILVSQKYDFEKYRFVLKKLEIEYHKPGTGTIIGRSQSPVKWPELVDGEAFIEMKTKIVNSKNEPVSDITTLWQVKDWKKTRKAT